MSAPREDEIRLRPAAPGEEARLTELVLASKRHWGYPESLIELWRDVLTITPERIEHCAVVVADRAGEPVGVVSVCGSGEVAELEDLWVHPDEIGRGLGRRLLDEAVAIARARGARTLHIVSDPFAEGFYLRRGARRVGMTASKPPGRELPELVLDLPGAANARET